MTANSTRPSATHCARRCPSAPAAAAVTVVVASAASVGVAVVKLPSAVVNVVVGVEKVPSVGAVAVGAAKLASAVVVVIETGSNLHKTT